MKRRRASINIALGAAVRPAPINRGIFSVAVLRPPMYRIEATLAPIHQCTWNRLPMSPAPKKPDESTYSGRVAAKLRAIRERAGLSVDQVVQSIRENGHDVPVSTYYKWESGMSKVHLDMLPAIARALGRNNVHSILPKD